MSAAATRPPSSPPTTSSPPEARAKCAQVLAAGEEDPEGSSSTAIDLAPLNITITGNTIVYDTFAVTSTDMHFGIALSGSQVVSATRQRATGVISGNYLYREGRHDSFVSGGIVLDSTTEVVVASNVILEPRSYGINCKDAANTTISGNTIRDVHKPTGGTAAAVYLVMGQDTALRTSVIGNKLVSGANDWNGVPVNSTVASSFSPADPEPTPVVLNDYFLPEPLKRCAPTHLTTISGWWSYWRGGLLGL